VDTVQHGLGLVPDPRRSLAVDAPRLQVERSEAEADNDGVTQQTIEQMCRYIRESAGDPYVARAAEQARLQFGSGNASCGDSPMWDAWGVFWFVKHLVKFRLDDGALLQWHGERDQQDLLISPAVLLRMKEPKEDCDGFSMLTCALLSELGIPAYLITVAADPNDPERWSHVFVAAMVEGAPMALDTSHGTAPGWMVPDAHIFRLQAWDLDGKKAQLDWKRRKRSGLHGYFRMGRGFGGLGQCVTPGPADDVSCVDTGDCTGCSAAPTDLSSLGTGSTNPTLATAPACASPSVLATDGSGNLYCSTPAAVTSGSSITPAQISSLISTAATGAANDIRALSAPAGYVWNPATGTYVPATAASSAAALSATFTSLLPILGIGLLAFMLIGAMGKK
jgi:hypothetical protein